MEPPGHAGTELAADDAENSVQPTEPRPTDIRPAEPIAKVAPDSQVDTVPVVIEATTGAPADALPSRAPQRQSDSWSMPTDPGHGPTSPDPPSPVEGVDEPAFWLPIEEVHWDGTPVRRETDGWFTRRRKAWAARHQIDRPPRPPRHPAVGLAGLILFGMLTSFFAWVTAEPLWLATGHADRGVATVTSCTGQGLRAQCRGLFTADAGWTSGVRPLVDVPASTRSTGARVNARMVGPTGNVAYADAGFATPQLRWMLGLVAALCCGPGIVWATGARRLPVGPVRRNATITALTGPVLIVAGFLAATY